MKRMLLALTVGVLLVGIGLSAVGDPIGVGGSFTASAAKGGIIAFPGKGVPQGGPFSAQTESTFFSPIGVGGS
jgi:hypothetical protein